MEFGIVYPSVLGAMPGVAKMLETAGFDYLMCSDTQNVAGDPYVTQAVVAGQTTRLRLGVGITNVLTRHPAVTACAAMTLQAFSGGRAVLGVGRGDSALAHVGLRPPSTAALREGLVNIRSYLHRQVVQSHDGLDSRLRWLDDFARSEVPPVPIDVAGTGPRTLRLAADVADRISISVGADPDLVRAAVNVIEARLAETGRSRKEVRIGVYVPLVAHDDDATAVRLARVGTGLLAHFPSTPGARTDHLPEQWRRLASKLESHYDMANHSQAGGSHLPLVDDEFVRWFGIAGTNEHCVERLRALAAVGVDHVYALGAMEPDGSSTAGPRSDADPASRLMPPPEWVAGHLRIGKQVIPHLKGTHRP